MILAALLAIPLLAGCETSIPDTSDPCNPHRQALRTKVDYYASEQPGVRRIDLLGHGVADIIPHLDQAARRVAGDGGYWAGLMSHDPGPDSGATAISRAFLIDIETRQSGPLDAMAAEFHALTQCRREAARDVRVEGQAGRLTTSVVNDRLEVGYLKYQADLDIANRGAVAVDIWRSRINEATDRLDEALLAEGVNPLTNQAVIEARDLIGRQDAFLAAVRSGREDDVTFSH